MASDVISISLTAEAARFSKGMQQAGADVSKLRQEVEHLKKQGGSDLFDNLRERFGKKSALGEGAELLQGKGPVRGLAAAAEEFKKLTEGALKLKEALHQGKDASEIAEGLVKSVPILGTIYEGFENIGELITGNKEKLADATAESKAMDESLKAQRKEWETLQEAAETYAEFLGDVAHRAAKAQLGDTDRKDAGQKKAESDLDADRALAVEQQRIEKEKQAQIKKLKEEAQPGLDAAAKARDEYAKAHAGDTGADVLAQQQNLNNIYARQVAARDANVATIETEGANKSTAAALASANEKVARQHAIDREFAEKHQETIDADGKEVADAQADAEALRLRTAGKTYQAEQVELRKALADRLAEIRKHATEEAKTYAPDDTANQQAVAAREQAAEAAAVVQNTAQVEAAAHEEEKRHMEEQLALGQQLAEAEQKRQEEINRLTEEGLTPQEKFIKQMEHLKELQDGPNGLSEEAYKAAAEKAGKDLLSSVNPQEQGVKQETRRFDFSVAKEVQHDPLTDLKEQQERTAKAAEQSQFYLQQLYQFGMNADAGQTTYVSNL